MSSILNYNRFLIVAFIMLCSGLILAGPPTCPPCQYWQWYEEEDYGECLDCDEVGMECCNEVCYSTDTYGCCNGTKYHKTLKICCGGNTYWKSEYDTCCYSSSSGSYAPFNSYSQECCGGDVITKCNTYYCLECDGAGGCLSYCNDPNLPLCRNNECVECYADVGCFGCQTCDFDDYVCVDNDLSCDNSGECIDGECEACWSFSVVTPSAYPCQACNDGCSQGNNEVVPYEYALYGEIFVPTGDEIGINGEHFSEETVRYYAPCVPVQTDEAKAYEFIYSIYNVYSQLSTVASCASCVAGSPTCVACFKSVVVGEILGELIGPCTWIEKCERCSFDDPFCGSAALSTQNVVDWDKVNSLCFSEGD